MIFLIALLASASADTCGTSISSYTVGDRVPVCVIFDDGIESKTITFQPKLDEYSAVEVKGIYKGLGATGNWKLAVQAESSNVTDSLQYLQSGTLNGTSDFVAPVYSVVIRMNDGKVDEVVWDNGCDLCNDECKTDTKDVCTIDLCDLNNNSTDVGSDCDPKIYVSWIGKDKDGNYLVSAGYRISQFRKYSLYDSYNSAKKSF